MVRVLAVLGAVAAICYVALNPSRSMNPNELARGQPGRLFNGLKFERSLFGSLYGPSLGPFRDCLLKSHPVEGVHTHAHVLLANGKWLFGPF